MSWEKSPYYFVFCICIMERQCGLRHYLHHAYGELFIKDIFHFISLGKKHANIINQQTFLESCRRNKNIPKSLRHKFHLNTLQESQSTHKLQLKTLNHIIKDKKHSWHVISWERKSLENLLSQSLSTDDFLQIVKMERNLFHHDFRMSKDRLTNNFTRLKYESRMINPV